MSRPPESNREQTAESSNSADLEKAGNPFSTRHIRPGAMVYLFSDEASADGLIARLRDRQWRGEIVGPHGSGKSTLLATLFPLLEQAGRKVVVFTLHAGERRLPVSTAECKSWNGDTQVVVDGYEQLGWWSRRWLDLTCRARGSGLLVTTHQSVGLPTIYQTATSLTVLKAIVDLLLPPNSHVISPADVTEVAMAHGGNTREALFALYDLYETRRRGQMA